MNKIFTLFLLVYSCSTFAQITYTEADGPKAGIKIYSRQLQDITTMNLDQLTQAGGNKSWDVRGSYLANTPTEYTGVQNLYFAADFPESNLAQVNVPNPDSSFTLFEKNSTGLYLIGSRDTSGEIVFSPKVTLIPFPLTFGTNYQNTTSANSTQSGVTFKIDLLTNATAESWGTMTTNDGTFPTLKVKTKRIVEISVQGIPFGSQTIESHTWLTSGLADPIVTLEYAEIESPGGLTHDTTLSNSYKQEVVRNLDVQKSGLKMHITPNPAADHVLIQCENISFNTASYSIINADGKTVMNGTVKNNEMLDLNINPLISGNYLVQLILDNKTALFDILSKQ